ncbi:MAG: hypothetical protein IPN17_30200 [Deltaproteobacteria bacterium]|nr:hypothetical protein [Deltaproteobacteria bacterium]MBK7066135.1 hypothetical protein [Deltaproteobacteria bacterium]MBK8696427.1 hypothetical protein [Deltaproteobacteria bacterium]
MKNEDTKPSRRTLAAVAAAAGAITLAAGVTLGSLLGVVKMPASAHSPPTGSSAPNPPAAPLTAAPEPEAQPAAAPEPEPVADEAEAETELLAQGRGHERRERRHERRHERHDEAEESEDD